MTLAAGSRLGPYEILGQIGAGGMGEVYRAKDPRLGRDVAIKVLPASFSPDADRLRRFEQEAKAAGVLNHPNITAVYDIGTHDGAPYVVQELLEGETLRAELAGGPLLAAQGDRLRDADRPGPGRRAREGHRPPGPEAREPLRHEGRPRQDPRLRPRQADADGDGSGRADEPADRDAPAPSPASCMGTLGYMSPEQVKGKPADARTDIFAFGAILYEMLSGKRAFHGDSAGETMAAILKEDPPDLSVTNQNISPGPRAHRPPLPREEPRADGSSPRTTSRSTSRRSRALGGQRDRRLPLARPARVGSRSAWPSPGLALLAAGLWQELARRRPDRPSTSSSSRSAAASSAPPASLPDGQTIVYSAEWEGAAAADLLDAPGGPRIDGARAPGRQAAGSFLRAARWRSFWTDWSTTTSTPRGTLAHVPLSRRSAPRDPARRPVGRLGSDGRDLASSGRTASATAAGVSARASVVHESAGLDRVAAGLSSGRSIVPSSRDSVQRLCGCRSSIVEAGRRCSARLGRLLGVSPGRRTARRSGFPRSIAGARARRRSAPSTCTGGERLLESGPATLDLHDVAPRRAAPSSRSTTQSESDTRLVVGSEARSAISSAGSTLAAGRTFPRTGSCSSCETELRRARRGSGIARTDGSPPVRLGEGVAHGLSPDGEWVLASQQRQAPGAARRRRRRRGP